MDRNPDIQRLLASLRGSVIGSTDNGTGDLYHKEPHKATENRNSIPSQRNDNPHPQMPSSRPLVTPNKPQQRSNTSIALEASSIITWPSAIKFVSKHIATNEALEAKIKRLITEQHKHERDWWAKREMIVNRYAGRAGNQLKAAELLRSLGGQHIPVAPTDPKAEVAELEAYDIKVHKSLTQLAAHYDRELRQMGVPFFAIKHDLVIIDDGKTTVAETKGRLDKGELRQLQGRMLTYLEELFGEES